MTKFRFLLFLALPASVLVSCKAYDIKPGSERIRVFDAEPKGSCIFLGEIPSVQENKVIGRPTTEPEMDLPTRVDLRNQAFALMGNVIVFAKSKKSMSTAAPGAPAATAAQAPAAGKPPAPGAPAVAPVINEADTEEHKVTTVFLATVFRCPPNIVNQ